MTEQLREELVDSTGGSLERYELRSWRDRFGIVGGITSATADFTLAGTPPSGPAQASWHRFQSTFVHGFSSVVVGYQSHGTQIAVHGSGGLPWQAWADVDGHVTATAGILLTATVADCIPVYLADPAKRVAAILHAGWRGVAKGIVEQGIARFRAVAKSAPSDIVTHCGVGICGTCYEVGPEVIEGVLGTKATGPAYLDLRAAISDRLGRLGVGLMSTSPWCAAHDAPRFHSHRGSGGTAGRMLAYVGMPLA